MCLSTAASSAKLQGNMNFASNTAPCSSTMPSRVAPIQSSLGGARSAARPRRPDPSHAQTSAGSAPPSRNRAGRRGSVEVLGLDLAPLLLPQPE
jgi:hypothetical protein